MKNQTNFYRIYALVLCISAASIFAASCSRASKTLAEIGDEKITLGEFEKQYLKTINNVDSARNKSLEDKKKFLDLYINFKLKVKDARERGLLNNADIQKDVAEYVKNYSPSYLIDKEIVEPEIKKLYPQIKVIMLSMHNDHSMISRMMEIGANSYLTKESDSETKIGRASCRERVSYSV